MWYVVILLKYRWVDIIHCELTVDIVLAAGKVLEKEKLGTMVTHQKEHRHVYNHPRCQIHCFELESLKVSFECGWSS